MRSGRRQAATPKKCNFSSKKWLGAVDGRIGPYILLTPPEAGLPSRKTKELVLAYFGTANWNSILSRFDQSRHGGSLRDGRQGWVFLWAEICVNRWFFDIYIQGSKYNFKS
jgi:hypothetical protein